MTYASWYLLCVAIMVRQVCQVNHDLLMSRHKADTAQDAIASGMPNFVTKLANPLSGLFQAVAARTIKA